MILTSLVALAVVVLVLLVVKCLKNVKCQVIAIIMMMKAGYTVVVQQVHLFLRAHVTLVQHFHWFTQHPGISKDALSSMLAMQHKFLPTGNNLPSSYEAAHTTCSVRCM